MLKILLSITPAEAAADNVTDGEEYESDLTKMAETSTERGVNEISKGDRNLDAEFRHDRQESASGSNPGNSSSRSSAREGVKRGPARKAAVPAKTAAKKKVKKTKRKKSKRK